MKVITENHFHLGDYEVAIIDNFWKIYSFGLRFIDPYSSERKITYTCLDPFDSASIKCPPKLTMESYSKTIYLHHEGR